MADLTIWKCYDNIIITTGESKEKQKNKKVKESYWQNENVMI